MQMKREEKREEKRNHKRNSMKLDHTMREK
jgi:hypothetical protein